MECRVPQLSRAGSCERGRAAGLVRRVEQACPAWVIRTLQTEGVRKHGGGRHCSRMDGQGCESEAGLTAWGWSRGSSPPPRPEACQSVAKDALQPQGCARFTSKNCGGGSRASACLSVPGYTAVFRVRDMIRGGLFPQSAFALKQFAGTE